MIFFIDSKPDYIVRDTKPRKDGSRSYSGQDMQARDIALRRLPQDDYRARCLDEHIIPHSIGTLQLSDDDDYAASLGTKLHGLRLHRALVSELTVGALGSFLSVLRCINVKELEERLGIQIPLIPFPNLKVLRESAIEAWTRLVERGQVSEEGIGDQGPINGLLERKTHHARKDTAPVFRIPPGTDSQRYQRRTYPRLFPKRPDNWDPRLGRCWHRKRCC